MKNQIYYKCVTPELESARINRSVLRMDCPLTVKYEVDKWVKAKKYYLFAFEDLKNAINFAKEYTGNDSYTLDIYSCFVKGIQLNTFTISICNLKDEYRYSRFLETFQEHKKNEVLGAIMCEEIKLKYKLMTIRWGIQD